MNLEQRISAFAALGSYLSTDAEHKLDETIQLASIKNPWFTKRNILQAIEAWSRILSHEVLQRWVAEYQFSPANTYRVGIIMAGNIPLVGFHDLLSVVLSGHHCVVKMSSHDNVLMDRLIQVLFELAEELKASITVVDRLKDIDAVIATGSDNSSRYFEYYFGKYPNIIRKNRTSVAIINGDETEQELVNIGKDVFSYFGLGCRNVSKLYFPKNYDIKKLLDLWNGYGDIQDHNKYRNNYDYHKSILLVNKEPHLDTGFSLWIETKDLVSPLSVVYYEFYDDVNDLLGVLNEKKEKIQCIVRASKTGNFIAPGETQQPALWDYADGVDTLKFLQSL